MAKKRLKITVLISGRGSNLTALINASLQKDYPAEIVQVVSNECSATGLQHAANAEIPTEVIPHREYLNRELFEVDLQKTISNANTDLIVLAGFNRILTKNFVDLWHNQMINIHPSLLPSFKGLHTHQRAIEAGVRFTGCTVHYVRPELDEGPIIVQAVVPLHQGENMEELAGRVLAQEHIIYPLAVRLIAEGRVIIDGTRTIIDNQCVKYPGTIINPLP